MRPFQFLFLGTQERFICFSISLPVRVGKVLSSGQWTVRKVTSGTLGEKQVG